MPIGFNRVRDIRFTPVLWNMRGYLIYNLANSLDCWQRYFILGLQFPANFEVCSHEQDKRPEQERQ